MGSRNKFSNRPGRRDRRSGLTLVELLVGLSVSALVMGAAAALAFAVSHAWSRSGDIRDVITHGRNGVLRISDRIRGARAVGFTSPDAMVLWREDANGDGLINLGELTLIRLDSQSGSLMEGQMQFGANAGADLRATGDTPVSAASFASSQIVSQLRQSHGFSEGPVAEYVESVAWVLDADPPAARLVQVRLRLTKQGLTQALESGATLRSPVEVR